MLSQPYNKPVTREVTGHSEGKGDGDVQAPSRWEKLVAEFHDIFAPPGMLVDRDTVDRIELSPNVEPYCRR